MNTLGLVLGASVSPAGATERDGAKELLVRAPPCFSWLRLLWVDGGYSGVPFAKWIQELRPKLAVVVVKRSDDVAGCKVLPRRWVVERTFGWLMRQRRLVRDYETSDSAPKPGFTSQ